MNLARFLALAIGIAGCRTDAQPPQVGRATVAPVLFPGADAILAGFDSTDTAAAWRSGDRVLYGLSTESGTETQTKLVEIELIGLCGTSASTMEIRETTTLSATVGGEDVTWTSDLLRVAVRVYEGDGRLVQRTEAKVPETVLRTGMYPAFARTSEWSASGKPIERSEVDLRIFAEAIQMLPTLLAILQDDGVLKSLLIQVVGPPPITAIFRGIDVALSSDFSDVTAVAGATHPCTSGATGPIYRLPVRLGVNDTPTLELEIDVVAADPPLRLAGGILALRGVSCRGAKRKIAFELLAARRGPAGAELRF